MENTFTIKSVQSCAFKILFQGISKIIDNCIIYINNNGIRIYENIDKDCLLYIKLSSDNLEKYEISNEFAFKLDLKIFKIICKNITSNSTIELSKNKYNYLSLECYKGTKEKYDINIEIVDKKFPKIDSIEFDNNFSISSKYFKDIITNLKKSLGEEVNFFNINEKLFIKCNGKNFNNEYQISMNKDNEYHENVIYWKKNKDESIINISLKYLLYSMYFYNLSNFYDVYYNQDKPFLYGINIASLGEIRFLIN
jgi:DNA polymerase III sliding clamp (beta) subunit (PCNA family)